MNTPNREVSSVAGLLEDELETFAAERSARDPSFTAALEDARRMHAVIDSLVKCRKALDLTQAEIARRMGVKQPTVSGFENESSDPKLSTLQRYARAVECSLEFKVDLPAENSWVPSRTDKKTEFASGSPYRAAAQRQAAVAQAQAPEAISRETGFLDHAQSGIYTSKTLVHA